MAEGGTIENSIKLVGEFVLPGASQLMDGNVISGVVHAALGYGALLVLGLPGALLVACDSYAQSTSGRSLYTSVAESLSERSPASPPRRPRAGED